jgi:sugar porter (SP) family MFS transporter
MPSTETPRLVYIAACIASLGGVFVGYDLAVISGAILFIKKQFALSATIEEFVTSSSLIGGLIGALLGGTLADSLGRRKTLILIGFIAIAGDIGSALSPNLLLLVIARIISGTAFGMASVTISLYISEISPAKARGLLVSFSTLAITSGILISFLADYAFSRSGDWRSMFALGAIPAFIQAIGMFFLPESPRWLAKHGLIVKAKSVLINIRGTGDVNDELIDISKSLVRRSSTWLELLSPTVRASVIVGTSLAIFRSITGFSIIVSYAPTIFEFAGFKSASIELLATVGLGITYVLFTLLVIRLIDRVGRRPLLSTGILGMALSQVVLGLAFYLSDRSNLVGVVAVISLMLIAAFYTIGPGAVIFLMISEIYPLKIRGLAMSIATTALWGTYWITTSTFLTLINYLGEPGTFWLYAFIGIVAWLFVYFLIPETKGRSLEEIEAYWHAKKRSPTPVK